MKTIITDQVCRGKRFDVVVVLFMLAAKPGYPDFVGSMRSFVKAQLRVLLVLSGDIDVHGKDHGHLNLIHYWPIIVVTAHLASSASNP